MVGWEKSRQFTKSKGFMFLGPCTLLRNKSAAAHDFRERKDDWLNPVDNLASPSLWSACVQVTEFHQNISNRWAVVLLYASLFILDPENLKNYVL
jgi:hypothetical protein